MGWKDKMKEFGGGDFTFLSEDGEVIKFIVIGEPILLEGKFKGKPSFKIGCPIVSEDGFVLLIAGKRLARKISKFEDKFNEFGFMAIRHGVENDINATYELKVLDEPDTVARLRELVQDDLKPQLIDEATTAALAVMQQ